MADGKFLTLGGSSNLHTQRLVLRLMGSRALPNGADAVGARQASRSSRSRVGNRKGEGTRGSSCKAGEARAAFADQADDRRERAEGAARIVKMYCLMLHGHGREVQHWHGIDCHSLHAVSPCVRLVSSCLCLEATPSVTPTAWERLIDLTRTLPTDPGLNTKSS